MSPGYARTLDGVAKWYHDLEDNMEKLYKFLNEDGRGTYSGFAWPLPTDTEPGEWVKVEGDLVPCQNGLHLCRPQDLLRWVAGKLYEAEYRGMRLDEDDKIVVAEARLLRVVPTWSERTMILFASDCAERVLSLFETRFPHDTRPRDAIAAARRCVDNCTFASAAGDAARAAGDAAWAARDAARAAGDAAWAARDAAGDAARAAGNAARAARDAAWNAARAAWNAAWAAWNATWAAGNAARAAGNAARAAWDAAGAAGNVARKAEAAWQNARLLAYLNGEIA